MSIVANGIIVWTAMCDLAMLWFGSLGSTTWRLFVPYCTPRTENRLEFGEPNYTKSNSTKFGSYLNKKSGRVGSERSFRALAASCISRALEFQNYIRLVDCSRLLRPSRCLLDDVLAQIAAEITGETISILTCGPWIAILKNLRIGTEICSLRGGVRIFKWFKTI